MMIEIWGKVFIAAILTVVIAKFFGCPWDIFLIFATAYIGWAVMLILFIFLDTWIRGLWKK
ncbi:MAG: hypothetical protein HYS56_02555 [Candidatus Omnitrophica bacterium]|nr:hypothetical protein [Candidatus Omnitrophota bacterium]